MLSIEQLKKIDKESMYKTYDKWPQIAQECYNKEFSKVDMKNIDHIVFAGMGGSGTIGDIFSSILSKTELHVTVVKGYLLPKTVDEKTLVVSTSISGNTDETLSILSNSQKNNAKFVAFSSGGIMEKYCHKNSVEYYKIKSEHSPRASFLGFLYTLWYASYIPQSFSVCASLSTPLSFKVLIAELYLLALSPPNASADAILVTPLNK